MNRRALVPTILLVVTFLHGQTAVVQRNVNLRSNPSAADTPIALLTAPTPLTLLKSTKHNGSYHVRTAGGQEGWVWGKNVTLSALPTARLVPAEIYPDPSKTPGVANPNVTQDNIADDLCSKTWRTSQVRPPASYTTP